MLPSEKIRIILFLLPVVSIFVMSGKIIAWSLFRFFFQCKPFTQGWKTSDKIILGFAGIGMLCILYGFFEPYWPEITHVKIHSQKLNKAARTIRMVHISDLHCDAKPRLEERLPGLIASEKPDLIVFTGDSVNSPAGLFVLKPCLRKIAQIAPTFVVRGNWDSWFWHRVMLFEDTGVQELNGNAIRFPVAGTDIWITGVFVTCEGRIDQGLASIPKDAFSVFLYHYPDEIEHIANRHIDLYCAGHTHGGQVALPFYGAIITLSKFGKKYESGLYQVGKTHLYVNRGIGMEGGTHSPRVRFCSRPEITVIELESGKKG